MNLQRIDAYNLDAIGVNKIDIIRLFLDKNYNFQVIINKWLFLPFFIIFLIWLFKLFKNIFLKEDDNLSKVYEIDEAMIGIGNQKIKIKPNYEDIQVAYKLWVELSTRKIGLSINFENDVIVEIYNSWYEFFKITRELIKEIPVSKVRKNESTQALVRIAVEVLNEGLRPHLTKWQAKFRKWYTEEIEKEENKGLAPQEIQKKFPEYEELINEMQEVNQKLIEYRKVLEKLVIEK